MAGQAAGRARGPAGPGACHRQKPRRPRNPVPGGPLGIDRRTRAQGPSGAGAPRPVLSHAPFWQKNQDQAAKGPSPVAGLYGGGAPRRRRAPALRSGGNGDYRSRRDGRVGSGHRGQRLAGMVGRLHGPLPTDRRPAPVRPRPHGARTPFGAGRRVWRSGHDQGGPTEQGDPGLQAWLGLHLGLRNRGGARRRRGRRLLIRRRPSAGLVAGGAGLGRQGRRP